MSIGGVTIPGFATPDLQIRAWHVALGLLAVSLALYVLARAQLERAKEDFANAYFYSPSTKETHLHRRKQWEQRSRALLLVIAFLVVTTAALYFLAGRPS